MKQVGGSIIPHDSSPSALPPLLGKLLVLGLRQSFLNAVLSLLIRIPPQTFTCTPEIVSMAAPVFDARGGDKGHAAASAGEQDLHCLTRSCPCSWGAMGKVEGSEAACN